jgi:hypothetical protein
MVLESELWLVPQLEHFRLWPNRFRPKTKRLRPTCCRRHGQAHSNGRSLVVHRRSSRVGYRRGSGEPGSVSGYAQTANIERLFCAPFEQRPIARAAEPERTPACGERLLDPARLPVPLRRASWTTGAPGKPRTPASLRTTDLESAQVSIKLLKYKSFYRLCPHMSKKMCKCQLPFVW